MIEKLKTSLLEPIELLEITTQYRQVLEDLKIVQGKGAALAAKEPFLQKLLVLMEADGKQLTDALAAVRKNNVVSRLAQANKSSDDLFISFKNVVNASRLRRTKELSQAHQLVWPVIEQAGTRLYRLGYKRKAGLLLSMFAELDKAPYQAALAALKAREVYFELKNAQADVERVYQQKVKHDQKLQAPTVTETKAPVIQHLYVLLGALGVLVRAEPEVYEPVIKRFNRITGHFMAVARARKTRKEQSNTDDTTLAGERDN